MLEWCNAGVMLETLATMLGVTYLKMTVMHAMAQG